MRRFTSVLTNYVSGKKKTLKYEFALVAFALEAIFLVRLLISSDPAWITAQQGTFSTFTFAVFPFILACIGLQVYQNQQDGSTTTTVSRSTEPGYIDGAPDPSPPSPEVAARSVG
jgi:hypothetical protein